MNKKTPADNFTEILTQAQAGNQEAMLLLVEQYRPVIEEEIAQVAVGYTQEQVEDLRQRLTAKLIEAIKLFPTDGVGVEEVLASMEIE